MNKKYLKNLKVQIIDEYYINKYGIINLLYSENILPFLIENNWEADFLKGVTLEYIAHFYEWNLKIKFELLQQIEIFESALCSHTLDYFDSLNINIFDFFNNFSGLPTFNEEWNKSEFKINNYSLIFNNVKLKNDGLTSNVSKDVPLPSYWHGENRRNFRNLIDLFYNYTFNDLTTFLIEKNNDLEFNAIFKNIFDKNYYLQKNGMTQKTAIGFLMDLLSKLRNELAHTRSSIYKLRVININYLRQLFLLNENNKILDVDDILNLCKKKISSFLNKDKLPKKLQENIQKFINISKCFDQYLVKDHFDLLNLRIMDAYYILYRINGDTERQALARKRTIENIIFNEINSWSLSLDTKNKIIDYLNKKCHLNINNFFFPSTFILHKSGNI